MLCSCGCGREAGIAGRTIRARGIQRGDELRFLPGHAGGMSRRRYTITSSDWREVDLGHQTMCWIWAYGSKNQWGHCEVWIGGKPYSAHRRMYEQEVGPIPDGLELDHLCRQPSCIRPEHLEPVTHAENIRRSALAKLDWETVRLIRESPLSCRKAAAEFGVSYSTIASVRRRDTWG